MRRATASTSRTDRGIGYLEILDRSGHVVDRSRVNDWPVRVGRAYDNDLIVADAYVSPHHLSISVDATGQVVAQDLDSANGLFASRRNGPVRTASLTSGEPVRIGHTRLRFRAVDYLVADTLSDHHTRKSLGTLEQPGIQFLIFALTLASLWLTGFLETADRREPSEQAFELVAPLAVICIWGGAWGFAGRVIIHRIKFSTHCAVICTALLTVLFLNGAFSYIAFALDIDGITTAFGALAGLILIALTLYAHLRFATLASPWRLGTAATAIAVATVGLMFLKAHVDNTEFSVAPQYHATLKPPQFQLVSGATTTEFFSGLSTLKDKVAAAAKDAETD